VDGQELCEFYTSRQSGTLLTLYEHYEKNPIHTVFVPCNGNSSISPSGRPDQDRYHNQYPESGSGDQTGTDSGQKESGSAPQAPQAPCEKSTRSATCT